MSIKVKTDYAIDKIEIDVIPFIDDKTPKIRFTSLDLSDDTMSMIFQDIDKYLEKKLEELKKW
jgi:hypothetical protein